MLKDIGNVGSDCNPAGSDRINPYWQGIYLKEVFLMKKREVLKTLQKMIVIQLRVKHILIDAKIIPNVKEIISVSLLIDNMLYRNPDKTSFGEEVVIVWYYTQKNKPNLYREPNWAAIPLKWLDQDFDIRTLDRKQYLEWLKQVKRNESIISRNS